MACRTMLLNRNMWSFIAGLLTGLAILHFIGSMERCFYDGKNDDGRNASSVDAQAISKNQTTLALEATQHPQRDLHDDLEDGRIPAKDVASSEPDLYNRVRVLCWVMTSEKNLYMKAVHVRATWTRRCNKVLFASEQKDAKFPTIEINVKAGRGHLTMKTMTTFDYVYKHHYNDADWFMKADDDTYVFVENLRYFLSSQNASEPVYFGNPIMHYVEAGYHGGGPGYVVSREALRRFAAREKGLCDDDLGAEDVKFGRCMELLGVKLGKTMDLMRRSRFHHSPVMLSPRLFENGTTGRNSALRKLSRFSNYTISLHKLQPYQMYAIEYLVYHLKTYGTTRSFEKERTPTRRN